MVEFNEPPLISSYDGIPGITPDSTVVESFYGRLYIRGIKRYAVTIECLIFTKEVSNEHFFERVRTS